ncbi:MAG: ATP-binding protein [Ignavibacteriales bacterium]|nr:ATP-binding protein [Ignavibacteriales bacterium]
MYQLTLSSDPKNIHQVEEFLLTLNQELHIDEEKFYAVMLVVTEAVNNGIVHGNKRDKTKQVTVSCSTENHILTIKVGDEGGGFDPRVLPDPLKPDNILRESGRGIFLMRQMMDSVSYNDNGTEVTMTLKF